MKPEIVRLDIADFDQCGNIWDMQRQSDLAERFCSELLEGIRTTYVYKLDGAFVGEISVVTETGDAEYTIPGRRLYVSRLIVRDGYRRRGIGRALVDYITVKAQEEGYTELSIGVNLDNYPALRLYAQAGFDRIISVCEDEYGGYVKLLKVLS
jgi:ribosomal protein S18 acetylase RimI-like enzyme